MLDALVVMCAFRSYLVLDLDSRCTCLFDGPYQPGQLERVAESHPSVDNHGTETR